MVSEIISDIHDMLTSIQTKTSLKIAPNPHGIPVELPDSVCRLGIHLTPASIRR
jgi:hypothetical protein